MSSVDPTILSDMIIPATLFGQPNYPGFCNSWLYICINPLEGVALHLSRFIDQGEAKYVALCWEWTLSGRRFLISFMVFKSAHSENVLKTRFGFSGGILLAKPPKKISPALVVQWMRGSYCAGSRIKPANKTFQEVRLSDYIMRGREHDAAFLASIVEK